MKTSTIPLFVIPFITIPCHATVSPAGGGNVSVNLVRGTWQVRGDDSPNAVTITTLSSNKVRLTGQASNGGTTTINGKPYQDITTAEPLFIALGDGNDDLKVSGTFGNTVTVLFERGIDRFYGSSITTKSPFNIDMGDDTSGSGNESATLIQCNLGGVSYTTSRAQGSNNFSLSASQLKGDLTIQGANHSNSISMASVEIQGGIRAKLGDEPNNTTYSDNFAMTACKISKAIEIDMGDGTGSVSLGTVTADRVRVTFGGGYDQLLVNQCSFRSAAFDGGAGNKDRVTGSQNIFTTKPDIRNFEVNELK